MLLFVNIEGRWSYGFGLDWNFFPGIAVFHSELVPNFTNVIHVLQPQLAIVQQIAVAQYLHSPADNYIRLYDL